MNSKTALSIPGQILILGAQGQVGSRLAELLGAQALGLGRSQVDLSDLENLERNLDQIDLRNTPITALINAAAYTQVDRAENEPQLAERVNSLAPEILAQWCLHRKIPLIHYSTDYVFSGRGNLPWREEDLPDPLCTYGKTKLQGEKAILQTMQKDSGKHLILRTSWVYDCTGNNFLRTMLRLGRERSELKVVADQWGAPTFALHLAQATLQALDHALSEAQFPSGIYHLCHSGRTSWHGFAEEIFAHARSYPQIRDQLKVERILPIRTKEYPTPARRPKNSQLNTEKIFKNLKIKLPDWQLGLAECLEQIRDF